MPTQVYFHPIHQHVHANLDTDENRGIVINGNYTLAIIRHFLDPNLIFVAIPVIYNICMDYGMALGKLETRWWMIC